MAQENRFSLGVELALPMGDFGDAHGFGIGGTAGFELPVGDHLGLMAQVGYISFTGKDIDMGLGGTVKGDASGSIPIQVGAKFYFTDNQEGFYAGLLTGIHMSTTEVSDLSGGTKTETNSNFSLAPLVGIIVGENIDIALRYQLIFAKSETVNTVTFATESTTETNGYLGVRAAYMFGGR